MEDYEDVRFKHDAAIECLTAEKISAVDIHRRVQTVYGDKCVDLSTVGAGCRRLSKTSWGKQSFREKEKEIFKDRIQKLVKRWLKCIEDG